MDLISNSTIKKFEILGYSIAWPQLTSYRETAIVANWANLFSKCTAIRHRFTFHL